jgi:hypothetical protein
MWRGIAIIAMYAVHLIVSGTALLIDPSGRQTLETTRNGEKPEL